MKAPIAYTYVILNERRRSTARWSLAIQFPNGILERLTTYKSRYRAVSAAKTLAVGSCRIEVRA